MYPLLFLLGYGLYQDDRRYGKRVSSSCEDPNACVTVTPDLLDPEKHEAFMVREQARLTGASPDWLSRRN